MPGRTLLEVAHRDFVSRPLEARPVPLILRFPRAIAHRTRQAIVRNSVSPVRNRAPASENVSRMVAWKSGQDYT